MSPLIAFGVGFPAGASHPFIPSAASESLDFNNVPSRWIWSEQGQRCRSGVERSRCSIGEVTEDTGSSLPFGVADYDSVNLHLSHPKRMTPTPTSSSLSIMRDSSWSDG